MALRRARIGAAIVATAGFAGLLAGGAGAVGPPHATEIRPGATPGWAETSPGFVVPDDPLLREQWWLFNFGQEIGGRVEASPGGDVRAPEAWAITQGSPEVVVALLDFGIDYDHPEFEGQLWTNPGETGDGRETNGLDDDGNGFVDDWRGWDFVDGDNDPMDEDGHGTAVAATVGARGGDGFGTTGIAPGVRILALRVGGERGVDQTITPAAIEYAAAAGARVVVQSYTTEPSGLFNQSDAETAAMRSHPEILFVTGAGNDGNDYGDFSGRGGGLKPCNNPDVENLLCVGGTTHTDEPWELSTFGTGRVHVAAPAESMLLASRPREVVVDVDLGDADVWAASADMSPLGTGDAGPEPDFAFESDDLAVDGSVLHITHAPPEGVESLSTLRLDTTFDLRGREGCIADLRVAGSMSTGTSASVALGFYRESDERLNPFAGNYPIGYTDLAEDGSPTTLSFAVATDEPFEAALRVQTGQFGAQEIDVRLDGFTIDCWNPEHGTRDYEYWDGTSFATPLVAGIAALVASAHPGLDALAIRRAITESVVPLPGLDGLVQTGGRVDAYGALLRATELADDGVGNGPAPPDDEPIENGDDPAAPAGFRAHEDYEIPAEDETLPIPAGRGLPDPAAPAPDAAPTVSGSPAESDAAGETAREDSSPQSASEPVTGGSQEPTDAASASSDDSSNSVLLPLGAGFFAVAAIGGGYFVLRRRRDGTYEEVGYATTLGEAKNAAGIPSLDQERAPWLIENLRESELRALQPGSADYETLSSVYEGGPDAWVFERRMSQVWDLIDTAGAAVDIAEIVAAVLTAGAMTPAAVIPEGVLTAQLAKKIIRDAFRNKSDDLVDRAAKVSRPKQHGFMGVGPNDGGKPAVPGVGGPKRPVDSAGQVPHSDAPNAGRASIDEADLTEAFRSPSDGNGEALVRPRPDPSSTAAPKSNNPDDPQVREALEKNAKDAKALEEAERKARLESAATDPDTSDP